MSFSDLRGPVFTKSVSWPWRSVARAALRQRSDGTPSAAWSRIAACGVAVRGVTRVLYGVCFVALVGCGAMDFGEDAPNAGGMQGDGDSRGPSPDDRGGDSRDSNQGPDQAMRLGEPIPSRNFVFIPNRSRGTLAKVSFEGGAIQITTVPVGSEPEIVLTHPTDDTALVLNRGSHTVSVVRAAPIGERDTVVTLPVERGSNQLSLSPRGDRAFAWYDNRSAESADIAGSLNTITLINLDEGDEAVFQVSVGLNVRGVQYDTDAESVYVVSDSGVSVIDVYSVRSDAFFPPVPLAPAGTAFPIGDQRDVIVTPSGALALVREPTLDVLRVVDLSDGSLADIALEGVPTDIELLPGGEQALVSVPTLGALILIDLAAALDGAEDALVVMDEFMHPVGFTSLVPNSTRALVYADSRESESSFVTVVDLVTMDRHTINLRKGVEAARTGPDGRHVVILHTKAAGNPVAGESEADILAKSWAFSTLDVEGGAFNLVRVEARPTRVVFTEDGQDVFVLVAHEASQTRSVAWVNLATFRTVTLDFDRLPEHVGVVPGARAIYVSQLHELGRIAFLDVDTGEIREVTGFELNSLIE